ncbi:hypothetical protein RP20_CCG019401 [Aedes albopictus]|nr:hypothetical protein RP20_CCG019401 [Aedes albopictus]
MKYFILTLALFGVSIQAQAPCTDSCWQSCPIDSRCPAVNGVNATLLSHPTDCSKYISCESGHGCPLDCPAGLHFHGVKKICTWSWIACCDPHVDCRPDAENGRDCVANSACVGVGSWETVLLPHPDCSKFYKCDRGEACPYLCPAGLHFNKDDLACDWPWRACCDPTVECKKPCDINTCPPTGPDNCDTGCPNFNCHENALCVGTTGSGKEAILLPHHECGKFYKCKEGSNLACEFVCPPGLHFNDVKLVCDWPWLACCDPSVNCVKPCIPGVTCAPSA